MPFAVLQYFKYKDSHQSLYLPYRSLAVTPHYGTEPLGSKGPVTLTRSGLGVFILAGARHVVSHRVTFLLRATTDRCFFFVHLYLLLSRWLRSRGRWRSAISHKEIIVNDEKCCILFKNFFMGLGPDC